MLTFSPSGKVSSFAEPRRQASLAIRCENSAIALVLADPENRRLGNDPPHHQAYDEIPGASLASAGVEDDETGAQENDRAPAMNILNPRSGRYTLSVIGARDGTYSCVISGRLENGARAEITLRDRPLRRGEVEQVDFTLAPESNAWLVARDSAVTRP